MKNIYCEEQRGVFAIYRGNSLLHRDDNMIQKILQKSRFVGYFYSLFCDTANGISLFQESVALSFSAFMKVGIMHFKCFK